jgi:hypothetical protein
VKSGMSIRDAENEFGIPKSTIPDNAAGDHGSVMGQPLQAERGGGEHKLLADWGFPFTSVDLCHFVKSIQMYPLCLRA